MDKWGGFLLHWFGLGIGRFTCIFFRDMGELGKEKETLQRLTLTP